MLIRLKPSALKQTRPSEYLVRFSLGGLATVAAGLIADYFGPEAGGLFLAFPAIFCASATLIEKYERARKAKKGLEGKERGRGAAAPAASGAFWGSLTMAIFALIVWVGSEAGAAASLSLASAAWLAAVSFFFYAASCASPHRSQT
jgi:hypothetical protein